MFLSSSQRREYTHQYQISPLETTPECTKNLLELLAKPGKYEEVAIVTVV